MWADLHLGRGRQEDGIAMKGAQVKWGGGGNGGHGVKGGALAPLDPPPIVTPLRRPQWWTECREGGRYRWKMS